MYIKEGLVYDKSTGTLTGYSDLEEVNTLLMAAEEKFKDPGSNMQRPLAKRMLVFMVRGLFTSLKFPYAQFPAASPKGAQLCPLLHQCIFRLTRLGLTVVSVTCDGASDNRRMFSLHGTKKDLTYKTVNVFCPGKPPVFFISDPSHLIKIIRNCFARGQLWVRHKSLGELLLNVCCFFFQCSVMGMQLIGNWWLSCTAGMLVLRQLHLASVSFQN